MVREVLYKKHDQTELHIASKDGNIEHVRRILREFANTNFLFKVDSNKETALHVAAHYGHTEVVKGLIDAARCLPTSADDNPHNLISCFNDFVRQANDSMNTALHLAVSNGNLDSAKLIVEADPSHRHIQNSEGATPIYLAAKLGYINIVKMLCQACTAPTLDAPEGTTALHAAISNLHKAKKEDRDVIKVLINAAKRSLSPASRFEAFIRQTDKKMHTALHLAVRGKHLDVIEQILQADPTYPHQDKDNESKTPIFIAAERGYKDITKLLCKTSEFGYMTLGPEDQTALHAAIRGNDADCVKYLLDRAPCLVKYCDKVGRTPLHYAAYYKFDSILEDILVTQESVGYQPVYGDKVPSPLCVAAQEGHTSTVIELMNLLPDQSCTDVNDKRQNVLHIAAGQSDKEMVECILEFCPSKFIQKILNDKDVNGDTPLHLLIREGCFVPEFINHTGVDKMARNNQNWTPLDMLYFQDKIKGDQLQIKKAIDDTQANQNWKFWRRSNTKVKLDTQQSDNQTNQHLKASRRSIKKELSSLKSLVPTRKRSRKDMEFKIAKNNLMKVELEHYRQRTNTQIIVTALITTVTFTVGFTLPGGYHQSGELDEGLPLLSKKTAFGAFMVTDALALALSTSSLFLYFISTMYQDPLKVSKLNGASTGLNIVSIIAMMLTFLTGTYVVLSHSPALAITVCIIICFFFLLVIVLSIKMICDRKDRKVEKNEV